MRLGWTWAPFRVVLAFALAAVATAGLGGVMLQSVRLVPFVYVAALLHAFGLGLPAFVVLRRFGQASWFACGAAGFLIGALPRMALTWRPGLSASMSDGVATIVQGSRTWAGWAEFGTSATAFGVFGAVGGFAFWLAMRLLRAGPSGAGLAGAGLAGGWGRMLAGVAVVGAASAVIVALPAAIEDRSCHNPARLHAGLAPEVSAYVMVDAVDWPKLVAAFEGLGARLGWSLRVAGTGETRGLVSACGSGGTLMVADRSPVLGRTDLFVFQPQGGTGWEAPTRALLDRLSAQWPGQLGFIDAAGRESGPPGWFGKR